MVGRHIDALRHAFAVYENVICLAMFTIATVSIHIPYVIVPLRVPFVCLFTSLVRLLTLQVLDQSAWSSQRAHDEADEDDG